MKIQIKAMAAALFLLLAAEGFGQQNIKTVFKSQPYSSGGYGAITNKFTRIRGEYANMVGIYGGWFVGHRLLIGAGAAAVTNNLPVPDNFSTDPLRNKSYEYGQVGAILEYVPLSEKAIHPVFHLFSGAGFSLQYERYDWHDTAPVSDENWFFVLEPGIQLEMNLLKWMRFSPGISYRASFGSNGRGLKDKDISDISYNVTLKFGKF